MFNFDSFSANSFYGSPFCQYGYMPYYSDPSYSAPLDPSLSSPFYPPMPYAFPPLHPSYDPEELKCPTLPTRESEDAVEPEEEEAEEPVIIIKEEPQVEKDIMTPHVKLEQKYGRNIASNIFHNIVRSVSQEPAFEKIIGDVIRRNRMTISQESFRERLRQRTANMRGYINVKTMRGLYMGKRIGATRQDLEFSKIMRIISKVYLKNFHVNHIFSSSKIKKKSRSLHFKRIPVLLRLIQ